MLSELPQPERNPSLVRLWTLKEAYSKAIGQGIQFRFTDFGFGPDGRPTQVNRPDGSARRGRGVGAAHGRPGQAASRVRRQRRRPYDAGLGRTFDTEITTMLDAEAAAAIQEALDVEWREWSPDLDD
ncbi:4'-phosphopantetheinyl transferase superfamily protein [Streptomyces sp. L7]